MRRRYEGFVNPGFRYLADTEVENPLLVVEEFFDSTEVEIFRQELRQLFALSFSNEESGIEKSDRPSRLIGTHQRATRLLEMAWLCLNNDRIELAIEKEHPLYQYKGVWRGNLIEVKNRLSDVTMQYCRVLQDTEINDVKKVFRNIFNYMTLSEWQDELDMLLFYSLSTTAMAEECENSNLCFSMYGLLEKLLECIHVINELKIKGDETWNILPAGTLILGQDNEAFPPELIMGLYQHENLFGQVLTESEAEALQVA